MIINSSGDKMKTLFRLGYVAMSVHIKNCSPSQTMTFSTFKNLPDRESAIFRLEQIAKSNMVNSLRLLKHNKANDIRFFRLSSRLIPLATHEELSGWNYLHAVRNELNNLGQYAREHHMRLDFHPDHYVVLNSHRKEVFKQAVQNLIYHYRLLKGMKIDPVHRCVIHLGGKHGGKTDALERFIDNWGKIPHPIQKMMLIENDDQTYHEEDVLYICEKLNIPMVFDIHHHLANPGKKNWHENWERILKTWANSPLPVKIHISSPKSNKQFRHHADYIDPDMFMNLIRKMNGTTGQVDCMIEAKMKDDALFRLTKDLKQYHEVKWMDQASFYLT